MTTFADRRLTAQQIVRHDFATACDVVAWMGAMQAQDYAAARWAVALRLKGRASEADIERAVTDGSILRTHALRGTWQLLAPADARWILALVAPRQIAGNARRYAEVGLDAAAFRKSRAALTRALRDGAQRTRDELAAALDDAGVRAGGQRLGYLLQRAELDALVCSGARRGKQSTHALFDDRCAPAATQFARDEALAELALRYFRSRGPATLDDFTWWSGLSAADARLGLAAVESRLASEIAGGQTHWRSDDAPSTSSVAHLLPPFDEYLIAYRDRGAVLDPAHNKHMYGGNGILPAIVVVDGSVIGTWQRTLARNSVSVAPTFFAKPTRRQQQAVAAAARRYAAFLGLPLAR